MSLILCLANSRKPPSGRCVAGRFVVHGTPGPWVRPVSQRPGREVSEVERRYENGRDVEVLDLVRIGLARPSPLSHQPENWLLKPRIQWACEGRIGWDELQQWVDADTPDLWFPGCHQRNGRNDRVAVERLDEVQRSLCLVRPESVTLHLRTHVNEDDSRRRRVRATFQLRGVPFDLSVTDPWVEQRAMRFPDRRFRLPEAVLCVSLAEPFHGNAYAVVASVITPRRAGRLE